MVDAFNDWSRRIILGDPLAQLLRIPIALGDEDRAGTCEVSWRLAQGAAREQALVAERLLAIDEDNIAPTTAQLTLSELPEGALTVAEAQALGATLADYFAGEDCLLFTPHPQRWYLRIEKAPDLQTLSPAACAGTLHESALPGGGDGAHWRRVITEVQMLLHSHPVNAAREADAKAPALRAARDRDGLTGGGTGPC